MPRAVLCRELGPPDRLTLEEAPPRPLEAGEARVEVHACGVNFPDILMVAGSYQLKPPLPFTPGMESAGRVSETGPGVTGVKVGDAVIAMLRHGGYADEIVLPATQLVALPPGFSFVEGATFMVGYKTAYHALVQRAALKRGEVLLVHGAAGGVGLAAVEIGKRVGATVIAAASSEEKLAVAAARGADHTINYVREPFVDAVKRITAGDGADVVYDPVGGEVFTQSLRCIAWGGRLLIIGFAGGTIPSVAANRVLIKGCSVIGVRAGEAGRRDPAIARATLDALAALAGEGKLKPHVSHTLPLERFADALRLLAGRKAIGRVALVTGRG